MPGDAAEVFINYYTRHCVARLSSVASRSPLPPRFFRPRAIIYHSTTYYGSLDGKYPTIIIYYARERLSICLLNLLNVAQ